MKKKTKTIAPRNPLVVLAKFKAAGAHGKSKKALRRAAKMEVQREHGAKVGQDFSPYLCKVSGSGWISDSVAHNSLF